MRNWNLLIIKNQQLTFFFIIQGIRFKGFFHIYDLINLENCGFYFKNRKQVYSDLTKNNISRTLSVNYFDDLLNDFKNHFDGNDFFDKKRMKAEKLLKLKIKIRRTQIKIYRKILTLFKTK